MAAKGTMSYLALRLLTIITTTYHFTHSLPIPRKNPPRSKPSPHLQKRRDVILSGISSCMMPLLPTNNAVAETIPSANADTSFKVYSVKPDASEKLSPSLKLVKKDNLFKSILSKQNDSNALWLGEHHNSLSDHKLQTSIIQTLHTMRPSPMAIGLEQIQVQFQPALDAFISGSIGEKEFLREVQWGRRWTWPYEVYRPVFDLAREQGIEMVALNVNSEDLEVVKRGGFSALAYDRLNTYIHDPVGFEDFAQPQSFKAYVNYVIEPSYQLHKEMGLLRNTLSGEALPDGEQMPFSNFFSSRILWDESMAWNAYRWVTDNPGGLFVGLVGCGHVKFQNGITGRFARLSKKNQSKIGNWSVMLNPTSIDCRPSGSMREYSIPSSKDVESLTLQLRYLKDGVDAEERNLSLARFTGGVLPLSDFIVYEDL